MRGSKLTIPVPFPPNLVYARKLIAQELTHHSRNSNTLTTYNIATLILFKNKCRYQ